MIAISLLFTTQLLKYSCPIKITQKFWVTQHKEKSGSVSFCSQTHRKLTTRQTRKNNNNHKFSLKWTLEHALSVWFFAFECLIVILCSPSFQTSTEGDEKRQVNFHKGTKVVVMWNPISLDFLPLISSVFTMQSFVLYKIFLLGNSQTTLLSDFSINDDWKVIHESKLKMLLTRFYLISSLEAMDTVFCLSMSLHNFLNILRRNK